MRSRFSCTIVIFISIITEKLLEIRQGESQEIIDWVGQLIEERRQQQACEEADTQLRRREREDLQRRRHEKKRQLLATIAAQENYYEASDLAIEVHYAKEDLKSLEALEEVVNALLNTINDCNREESPIVIAGTPEWKLSRMYEKATKLRQQKYPPHLTLVPPSGSSSSRCVKSDDSDDRGESLDPYAELAGKVVGVMAGSYHHVVDSDGLLLSNRKFIGMIENLGDAYEMAEDRVGRLVLLLGLCRPAGAAGQAPGQLPAHGELLRRHGHPGVGRSDDRPQSQVNPPT